MLKVNFCIVLFYVNLVLLKKYKELINLLVLKIKLKLKGISFL